MDELLGRARLGLKQAAKRPARRTLRRLGYELVAREVDPERHVVALLERLAIRMLIDVGANQGQYAEHMRAAGYTGLIHSFEPGSAAFVRLARAARTDPDWTATRAALGAEAGQLALNISVNSVSSSLLTVGDRHVEAAPASKTVDRETVRVVRLDEEVADLAGPAMLKIDTQGFELPVLQGAAGVLDEVAAVQLELSLVELYDGQPNYFEVLHHLYDLGFHPWSIVPAFSDPVTGQMLQVDVLATRRD